MVWRLDRLGRSLPDLVQIVAEFERSLIRERTQAGLAAARARGRSGGRKPKLDEQQVRESKILLCDPDIRVADVAHRYGVSRTTRAIRLPSCKAWRCMRPTIPTPIAGSNLLPK